MERNEGIPILKPYYFPPEKGEKVLLHDWPVWPLTSKKPEAHRPYCPTCNDTGWQDEGRCSCSEPKEGDTESITDL